MTKTSLYVVQQDGEDLPEGAFGTLEAARAGMAELENNCGWRGLSIARRDEETIEGATYMTGREVLEYGLEREGDDEE